MAAREVGVFERIWMNGPFISAGALAFEMIGVFLPPSNGVGVPDCLTNICGSQRWECLNCNDEKERTQDGCSCAYVYVRAAKDARCLEWDANALGINGRSVHQ